jgi:hypothetical protein
MAHHPADHSPHPTSLTSPRGAGEHHHGEAENFQLYVIRAVLPSLFGETGGLGMQGGATATELVGNMEDIPSLLMCIQIYFLHRDVEIETLKTMLGRVFAQAVKENVKIANHSLEKYRNRAPLPLSNEMFRTVLMLARVVVFVTDNDEWLESDRVPHRALSADSLMTEIKTTKTKENFRANALGWVSAFANMRGAENTFKRYVFGMDHSHY